MTLTNRFTGVLAVIAVLVAYFAYALPASANPLRFPPAQSTSSATTSPSYFAAGAATSTLATYDTYANNGSTSGSGSTQAMDKVAVLIQHTASTSASVGTIAIEHSMDGIDWYQDDIITPTSVGQINTTNPLIYTMIGNSTSSTTLRVIQPSAPLRFIRVRGTVAGANGALWVSIQPQKQNP